MKFRGWKGEKDLGKFKGKNMIKMCCMKILKKKQSGLLNHTVPIKFPRICLMTLVM